MIACQDAFDCMHIPVADVIGGNAGTEVCRSIYRALQFTMPSLPCSTPEQ